jgi:hypothetical protein
VTSPRNDCPTASCDRRKQADKAFCLPCWRQLPLEVQRQVWASYTERDLYDHVDFLLRLGARIDAGAGPWPPPNPD